MAEKFLSLSGMQTLWNKVKSVFATKTELNTKADKTDLISKSSSFALNTLGNRWVRLASFTHSLRGGTTINIHTAGVGASQNSAYKLTFFSGVGYGGDNLIIEGVGATNYYAIKKFRIVRKGGAKIYVDAFVEIKASSTGFIFYLGAANEVNRTEGLNKVSLYNEDVEVTIPEGYITQEYVLNNTSNAWIQADLHGNADTATKATQDESGNNIVNTYATKEALNSANQSIAGLTSGVNSKLEKDGSNASSATTSGIFDAAAGGASDSYTIEDNTQILLKDEGDSARKYYLSKFIDYLRSKLIRDSFSPPTSTNVAPTVGAVTTVIENKEKNLKETYFDATPVSIAQGEEKVLLEISYSSTPDLYQRVYELNICSNIKNQTNFKIIFCPSINNSKTITSATRVYVLGNYDEDMLGLFRFSATNNCVTLSCKYESSNNSNATRSVAISVIASRSVGFNKVNKPITDYEIITSFYLNDSTYVKPYVTSDELNTAINNIRKENYSWTNASTYNGFIGMPMTICWNGGTSVGASTLFEYGSDYTDDGRILVFVNGTSGSVSVTGLTDGSYSVSKGRTLQIVKWGNSYFPMNDKT